MNDALREAVEENQLLRLSLKVMTNALDELVGACMTPDGKAAAPTHKELMRARAYLPRGAKHAFKQESVASQLQEAPNGQS